MPRTLRDLKRMPAEKFDKLAVNVTHEYGRTDLTQKEVAKKFNVGLNTVRGLIEHAIVHDLVSMDTVRTTYLKAVTKQKSMAYTEATNSTRYYTELIRERRKWIAYNTPVNVVNLIATEYAKPDLSVDILTDEFKIEDRLITQLIIERSIAENIASDEVTEAIINKTSKPGDETYFELLRARREENAPKNKD